MMKKEKVVIQGISIEVYPTKAEDVTMWMVANSSPDKNYSALRDYWIFKGGMGDTLYRVAKHWDALSTKEANRLEDQIKSMHRHAELLRAIGIESGGLKLTNNIIGRVLMQEIEGTIKYFVEGYHKVNPDQRLEITADVRRDLRDKQFLQNSALPAGIAPVDPSSKQFFAIAEIIINLNGLKKKVYESVQEFNQVDFYNEDVWGTMMYRRIFLALSNQSLMSTIALNYFEDAEQQ